MNIKKILEPWSKNIVHEIRKRTIIAGKGIKIDQKKDGIIISASNEYMNSDTNSFYKGMFKINFEPLGSDQYKVKIIDGAFPDSGYAGYAKISTSVFQIPSYQTTITLPQNTQIIEKFIKLKVNYINEEITHQWVIGDLNVPDFEDTLWKTEISIGKYIYSDKFFNVCQLHYGMIDIDIYGGY